MFNSNYASNYLPIKARFPEDKANTLALLDIAHVGKVGLRSVCMRAF